MTGSRVRVLLRRPRRCSRGVSCGLAAPVTGAEGALDRCAVVAERVGGCVQRGRLLDREARWEGAEPRANASEAGAPRGWGGLIARSAELERAPRHGAHRCCGGVPGACAVSGDELTGVLGI